MNGDLSLTPGHSMRFPDNYLRSLVFVVRQKPDGNLRALGTCFMVFHGEESHGGGLYYFVSAWHVVKSAAQSSNGNVLLRINSKDGNAKVLETRLSDWKTLDDDSEADLAAMTIASSSAEL